MTENDFKYKEHLGVVFDDLRVPDKLTLQSINKVLLKYMMLGTAIHSFL